ncbi:hypothetical protein OKW24_001450 [Peribacillus simplex]|uniref:hypothetical protein n=1 Tax=Peribacillus simplex TaxID=1478 RepID=UPI0024E236C4|nr:hypothetical protein [Peribacillus simplex]MDF9759677.1 hypothetical protein [Peribacillus simplex]
MDPHTEWGYGIHLVIAPVPMISLLNQCSFAFANLHLFLMKVRIIQITMIVNEANPLNHMLWNSLT